MIEVPVDVTGMKCEWVLTRERRIGSFEWLCGAMIWMGVAWWGVVFLARRGGVPAQDWSLRCQ